MDIARGNKSPIKVYSDFTTPLLNCVGPWTLLAIASGTSANGNSTTKHPGTIIYKSHASNTNSGYGYYANQYTLLLGGGEKTTIIFKTAALTGVTRRLGFHDSIDSNAPTDGVYCLQNGDQLTGRTMNNTSGSITGTAFTLAANTWYRLVIELNADASLATYTLYADDSMTVLWTDALATNIPTGAGRFVGHSDVCTLASPSGATEIGTIDYMDIILPNARRVE